MGYDIKIDVLPDNLHTPEYVRGDRTYDDAVMILIKRLHLYHVILYPFVFLHTEISKENGLLYAIAAHPLQVFHYIVSHLPSLEE